MTGIALLANENFPRPSLLALRAAGVDVEGHLVVIDGRSLRRRPLPAAAST